MSWLFGKKKHQKDAQPDATEEEQGSDQAEGFVFLAKQPAPAPPNVLQDAAVYPTGNLYPYVPPVAEYSKAVLSDPSRDHNQGDGLHYLSGVPFKLCKHLEIGMNSDVEIDRLRISEILSFIERVENQNYDYSFSLEQGIVAEMNSRRDE